MKKFLYVLFLFIFIVSCADDSSLKDNNNTDNGSHNPNNPPNIIPAIPLEPSKPIHPDNSDNDSHSPNNPQDIIPAIPLEPSKPIHPDNSGGDSQNPDNKYDYDVIVSTVSHINRDTDINKWGFKARYYPNDPGSNVLADKLGRPTSTSTETMGIWAKLKNNSIEITMYNHYDDIMFRLNISANKSFEIHDRELIWETMAEYIKKDPYTNKDNKKETITIKSSAGK